MSLLHRHGLLRTPSVAGTPVTVLNPEFNDDTCAPGGLATLRDWIRAGAGSADTFWPLDETIVGGAQSGDQCLVLYATSELNGAQQTISETSIIGTTYTFSGWYAGTLTSSNAGVQIAIREDGEAWVIQDYPETPTYGLWYPFSVSIVASVGGRGITISMAKHALAGGLVLFDNVKLIKTT